MLDHKRSNAINIGMTKLPPPRSIKTAILKMDSTVMNREGIEVGGLVAYLFFIYLLIVSSVCILTFWFYKRWAMS